MYGFFKKKSTTPTIIISWKIEEITATWCNYGIFVNVPFIGNVETVSGGHVHVMIHNVLNAWVRVKIYAE